jgi:glutamate synthase (NADPH/NADH) large chain
VNPELVDVDPLTAEDGERLRSIVERHVAFTDSAVGAALLADWPAAPARFSVIMPRDFKRVLAATRAAEAAGEDVEQAVMAAARA